MVHYIGTYCFLFSRKRLEAEEAADDLRGELSSARAAAAAFERRWKEALRREEEIKRRVSIREQEEEEEEENNDEKLRELKRERDEAVRRAEEAREEADAKMLKIFENLGKLTKERKEDAEMVDKERRRRRRAERGRKEEEEKQREMGEKVAHLEGEVEALAKSLEAEKVKIQFPHLNIHFSYYSKQVVGLAKSAQVPKSALFYMSVSSQAIRRSVQDDLRQMLGGASGDDQDSSEQGLEDMLRSVKAKVESLEAASASLEDGLAEAKGREERLQVELEEAKQRLGEARDKANVAELEAQVRRKTVEKT